MTQNYCAPSVYRACAQQRSSTRVSPLLTAKWIYLHDFLTFTDEKCTRDMSVMHWGKQNVSNALNSTDIFAVCYGGSIWSMIDIKGCLRISVYKLVRLCDCVVYNRFSPDWFVRLFDVRFWTLIPVFPQVSVVLLWFIIVTRSGDERTRLRHSFNLHKKYWSQIIGHFLNNKSVAHH